MSNKRLLICTAAHFYETAVSVAMDMRMGVTGEALCETRLRKQFISASSGSDSEHDFFYRLCFEVS